jgi:hypothetical protein
LRISGFLLFRDRSKRIWILLQLFGTIIRDILTILHRNKRGPKRDRKRGKEDCMTTPLTGSVGAVVINLGVTDLSANTWAWSLALSPLGVVQWRPLVLFFFLFLKIKNKKYKTFFFCFYIFIKFLIFLLFLLLLLLLFFYVVF